MKAGIRKQEAEMMWPRWEDGQQWGYPTAGKRQKREGRLERGEAED